MLYRAEDSERSVAIKTTNPRLLRNTKKTRLTSVTTDEEPVSQSECNLSSFWAERSQERTTETISQELNWAPKVPFEIYKSKYIIVLVIKP